MSRSYRRPFAAITGTASAKDDKRLAQRGLRRKQNLALKICPDFGNLLLPHRFECAWNNNYCWGRDGAQCYPRFHAKFPGRLQPKVLPENSAQVTGSLVLDCLAGCPILRIFMAKGGNPKPFARPAEGHCLDGKSPQVVIHLFFPANPPITLYPNLPDLGVCGSTPFLRYEALKLPIMCASNATELRVAISRACSM